MFTAWRSLPPHIPDHFEISFSGKIDRVRHDLHVLSHPTPIVKATDWFLVLFTPVSAEYVRLTMLQ